MIISIAPMMNCTDRHDRYLLRLIAPDVLLYTEMVTAHALVRGRATRLLMHHPEEHPVALQLGGSDPKMLSEAAKMGEEAGYDEINLNVGCPSPRVSAGRFGACLMKESALVAECVSAMQQAVRIPITVKCRIGVDDRDSDEELNDFIRCVAEAGVKTFIVHARKAWLKGLSPKENRDIPPLQYERVYRLKADFPQLRIIINGGLKTVSDIKKQLDHVDGVMIGREAYSNPYWLAEVQKAFYPERTLLSRYQIIQGVIPYIREQLGNGVRLQAMTRHLLGLFQGQSGASSWRRYLSQHAHLPGAGVEVVERALETMYPHPNPLPQAGEGE